MVAPTKVKRRFIAQQGGGQQNGSAGQLFAGDSECEFFYKMEKFRCMEEFWNREIWSRANQERSFLEMIIKVQCTKQFFFCLYSGPLRPSPQT